MSEHVWDGPLYNFLRLCEESRLEKRILDCGAGGERPPLSLFFHRGYETAGVEIEDEQFSLAIKYCADNDEPLNIIKADMRHLPFPDESFSFAYTYHSIMFMTKPDIAASVQEMIRVLRPDGLIFVNLWSVDDPEERPFKEGSFAREMLGSERFAKYEDDEADVFFKGLTILHKEKRIIDTFWNDDRLIRARIDYMARK